MVLLDAATDREQAEHRRRIDEMRMAMIFSRSQPAYDSWRSQVEPQDQGLSGAALERVLTQLAGSQPEFFTVVR